MDPRIQEPRLQEAEANPERLRQQAKLLRRSSTASIQRGGPRETSLTAKSLSLACYLLILAAVTVLLVSSGIRQSAVRKVVSLYHEINRPEEGRLFRLPPPKPKPQVTRLMSAPTPVIIQEGAPARSAGSQFPVETQEVPSYILIPNEPAPRDKPAPLRGVPGETVAEPTGTGAASAFDFLKENDAVAARVIDNGFSDYSYQSWTVVAEEHPQYYISLLTKAPDGREAVLIWLVNLEKKTTEPKSQEARELAARDK